MKKSKLPPKSEEDQLAHDKYQEEIGASRVNKEHGGELVEAISTEDLEMMNDPANCTHEWERDETETLGEAYMCVKPLCGIVKIL